MEYEGKESEGLKEVGKKVLSVLVSFLKYKCVVQLKFSNSLIIHQAKTKEITTVEEVWKCDLNYHKILWTFASNFSKNYQ